MNTDNRRSSHLYLERLQKAAYGQLGYPPPTFSAETLRRREAESLDALREGGEYDVGIKKRLGVCPSNS